MTATVVAKGLTPERRKRLSAAARTFKKVGHPIRLAVLMEMAAVRRSSPRMVAEALGEPLGNVSYHVRVLLEDKMVELIGTEPRRGAVEHFYKVTPRGRTALRLLGDG